MTRRPPLGLTALEDRTTPATASYAAGTLTITAATGDALFVSQTANAVPGYYRVDAGAVNVFDSGADRPVRNLVVKPAAGPNNYWLNLLQDISLTNLTVTGAPNGTFVSTLWNTRINGNFSFQGSPAATGNDFIWVSSGTRFGGKVSLALGGGNNVVRLDGGEIGGSVSITGGAGDDTVEMLAAGPLYVGGSVSLGLGGGFNQVNTTGGQTLLIGKNLTYTGGTGDDHVDLSLNNPQVRVGGSVSVDMPPATGVLVIPAKYWYTGSLFVGGDFTARHALEVELRGPTFVGGNLAMTANPGGGSTLGVGWSTAFHPTAASAMVGGSITYTGGAMDDTVTLDNLTVGKGVNLNLGGGGLLQQVNIGTTQNASVAIGGGLTIYASGASDSVDVMRATVGGAMTYLGGGGADWIWIDNSDIGGPAQFDLGAGNDVLQIDTLNGSLVNGAPVALPLRTRFESSLTVYGRDGADDVSLGNNFGGTGVTVGGAVRLYGGGGADNLTLNLANNLYLGTKFNDFEFGDNL